MTAGVATEVAGQVSTIAPAYSALVVLSWWGVGILWMGLALGAVYSKAGARPAMAWIPVLRYVEMARATQSNVAGTAVARVLAAAGVITWLVAAQIAGASGVALGGLVVGLVAGFSAWVMWIVQARRFGLDHSLADALPLLAAVAPAIWAAVVGWSRMVTPRPAVSGPVAVRGSGPTTVPTSTAPPAVAAGTAATRSQEASPVHAASPGAAEPVRLSPFASLAPRDGAVTGELPTRRSPYASLAPRDEASRWTPPEGVAKGLEDFEEAHGAEFLAAAAAHSTPDVTAREAPEPAPDAPEPATDLPLPADDVPPLVSDVPALAPEEPDQTMDAPASDVQAGFAWAATVTPATEEIATPRLEPLDGDDEADASPAPAVDPLPAVDPGPLAAPFPRPVYVEPTPTLPVSPYMRGGAAAPPPAPTAVPTFEIPIVALRPPAPLEPEPSTTASSLPVDSSPALARPVPPAADDRTQVSARVREAWELATSEGDTYRVDATTVLLGRAGGLPPTDGTPRVDIADSTRTMSKSHARLTFERGTWLVEDLGSTNGTYLVDHAGREVQVAADTPTPVEGKLLLGDVEVELRRRGAGA